MLSLVSIHISFPTNASPLSLVVGSLLLLITVAATPVEVSINVVIVEYPGKSCKVSESSVINAAMSGAVDACVPVVELNGPTVSCILTNLIQ